MQSQIQLGLERRELAVLDEDPGQCCDGPAVREEGGFQVCVNCGMVHDNVIDDASMKRAFTREEIEKRRINEPVYSPIGPRTVLQGNADFKGKMIKALSMSRYTRLSKIQRSLTSSYERNLWLALPRLQRMKGVLSLPNSIESEALRLYTLAVKKRLTMGRSIDALLAACIYAVLRMKNLPRTLDEVAELTCLDYKKVVKAFRLLLMEVMPELEVEIGRMEPVDFIDRFIADLGMSMKVRKLSVKFLQLVPRYSHEMVGKDPKGIAAAAIYLASRYLDEQQTQAEIARVARVTEVTLRSRAKKLKEILSTFVRG